MRKGIIVCVFLFLFSIGGAETYTDTFSFTFHHWNYGDWEEDLYLAVDDTAGGWRVRVSLGGKSYLGSSDYVRRDGTRMHFNTSSTGTNVTKNAENPVVYFEVKFSYYTSVGGDTTNETLTVHMPGFEPDPCGPLDFQKHVVNSSRMPADYELRLGGAGGYPLDTFSLPPNTEIDYRYQADDICESVVLFRMSDDIPFKEEGTGAPTTDNPPPPPPDFEEPPEDPVKELDYNDTDTGKKVEMGNPDANDDEKTRELMYELSKDEVESIDELKEVLINKDFGGSSGSTFELPTEVVESITDEGDLSGVEDVTSGADEIDMGDKLQEVEGLTDLLPSAPTISTPSTETRIHVTLPLPEGNSMDLDIDLTKYAGPIALFRALAEGVLLLYFFLMMTRVIREAFA